MKIKNKITIATFLILSFTSLTSTAQTVTYPKWQDVYADYTATDLMNAGCDPNVMTQMFTAASQRYMPEVKAANQVLVQDQVAKAPEAKSMMACVDGAMSSIKSITNSIDKILGILGGSVSPSSIADSISKQMTNLACAKADNYITGKIYNSTNGIMGKVNTTVGLATNGVNINTGLGNVNVGGGAIQEKTTNITSNVAGSILK